MPTTLRIYGEIYALRICVQSTDVGFRRDCITAHDDAGRSLGWYWLMLSQMHPHPFRTEQMNNRWEESGAFQSTLKEKVLPPIEGISWP